MPKRKNVRQKRKKKQIQQATTMAIGEESDATTLAIGEESSA